MIVSSAHTKGCPSMWTNVTRSFRVATDARVEATVLTTSRPSMVPTAAGVIVDSCDAVLRSVGCLCSPVL
jgi:hypothetical protein